MHSKEGPQESTDETADDLFFRAGDDGSYATGNHSLPPVTLETFDDLEPPRAPVDEAWLARRARLTRRVVGGVLTLAIFAAVAPFAESRRLRAEAETWSASRTESQRPATADTAAVLSLAAEAPLASPAPSANPAPSADSAPLASPAPPSDPAPLASAAPQPEPRTTASPASVPTTKRGGAMAAAHLHAQTLPVPPSRAKNVAAPQPASVTARPVVSVHRAPSVARFDDPS